MAASTTVSTWRDGRAVGRHIVDRALDYAALNRGGLTAAQIARRRKKSKGYVSIVLRLGTAIRGLDREELAVFRSERITWKLAQRIVRGGVTDAEIQRQMRYALGGFSTHNIDRRKLRKHRVAGPKQGPSRGLEPSGTVGQTDAPSPEAGVFVWRWDGEWAARDPAGYVEAYREHLASLHRNISTRFRKAMVLRATRTGSATASAIPMVGQSLRQINALIAQRRRANNPINSINSINSTPELTTTDREALASLTALDAILCGPVNLVRESDPSSPIANAPDPRPPSATGRPDGSDVAQGDAMDHHGRNATSVSPLQR